MKFEWDESKNQKNIKKHGVSFEQACAIFENFTLDFIDERSGYGEIREISIGRIKNTNIIVVVYTDRGGLCRIISARPALKREKKLYDTEIQKTFDA